MGGGRVPWGAGCAQRPGLRGTDISGPTYPVGPVGRSPGVRRARRLPSRQTSCWGQTDAYTSASLTSGRPEPARAGLSRLEPAQNAPDEASLWGLAQAPRLPYGG